MTAPDPRSTYDFDNWMFVSGAREYARELYACGNPLVADLQTLMEFMPANAPDGYVNEVVRAFLAAWVIEDAQPFTGSLFKRARRKKEAVAAKQSGHLQIGGKP